MEAPRGWRKCVTESAGGAGVVGVSREDDRITMGRLAEQRQLARVR